MSIYYLVTNLGFETGQANFLFRAHTQVFVLFENRTTSDSDSDTAESEPLKVCQKIAKSQNKNQKKHRKLIIREGRCSVAIGLWQSVQRSLQRYVDVLPTLPLQESKRWRCGQLNSKDWLDGNLDLTGTLLITDSLLSQNACRSMYLQSHFCKCHSKYDQKYTCPNVIRQLSDESCHEPHIC